MNIKNLKYTAILLAGLFMFQSCSDDDDDLTNVSIAEVDTAELIIEWGDLWLSLDQFTIGMRPNSITRSLAYIHLTGYETAVPFMSDYTSNTIRLNDFDINLDNLESNVDVNLALNTAYAIAMDHFMISLDTGVRDGISSFQAEKEAEITEGLSDSEIENSKAWGRHIALSVINYSETDTAAEAQIIDPTPSDYVAPIGVGLWEAGEGEAAWFPYWRDVRTFAISPAETSSVNFDLVLPHSIDISSEYYIQMNDVFTISTAAREEENEDLWISEFWSDDVEGLMISPPGRQFSIANQLLAQNDVSYERSLELLLRLGFAVNDAAVSAWDDKYIYNIERPSNYILEYINEDFTTNLTKFIEEANPAFPSYPSGHATFAGVSSGVFISFFGTDTINFTDNTYANFSNTIFNGTARTFSSFSEMATENAYSRVPLGVHVEQDAIEGLRLGYEISEAINNIDLQ